MKLIHDIDNIGKMADRIEQLKGVKIKVGLLGSGDAGATHDNADITILEIGNIHEFGAPSVGIPERSFIRSTFDEKEGEMAETIEVALIKFVMGDIDYEATMDFLGSYLVGLVQQTIADMTSPPNKPATIKYKGSSGVLVDTGQLVGSISYEVV
jgi:hypothetical protein